MQPTPDPDPALSALRPVAESALLHEAMQKRGALNSTIQARTSSKRLLGRALTVYSPPGDNLMLHYAVSVARAGDVLMAGTGGYIGCGVWGEVITIAAQARGIAGLVTDGAVRDLAPIGELAFPVFSAGVCIRGTTKRQKGHVNQPIVLGDVLVHPGDFVVGDGDGVAVVPAADIDAVIAVAKTIRAKEAAWFEQLRAGASTLDLLNVRGILKELGFHG